MPVIPPIPYSQIRNQLQTGDVIMFQGDSAVDIVIELPYMTGYSHVGMVIRDSGNLYFWDAPGPNGNEFPDPYWSDPKNRIHNLYPPPGKHPGCRVAVLDDLLKFYVEALKSDQFTIRQLQPAVTPEMFSALRIFIDSVDGLPFPALSELPVNFTAGQAGITMFAGTYYCSQLVADSYLHMGLLPAGEPANSYPPSDFASTPASQSETVAMVV
jgi:hypothetical protein